MHRSFSARHTLDGAFWLVFVLLAWFLVYMGFAAHRRVMPHWAPTVL